MKEMEIQELRKEIDEIDRQIVNLYCRRMETAVRIGEEKRKRGLPVRDAERERELLDRVGNMAGKENENGVRALFSLLMAQSRSCQLQDRETKL